MGATDVSHKRLKTQNSKRPRSGLVLIEHALNLFRVLRFGERDR